MRKNFKLFHSARGMSMVQVMVVATLLAGLSWIGTTVIRQFGEGQKSIELRGVADNLQQRMKVATQSPIALAKSKALSAELSACVAKCLASPNTCMGDPECPNQNTAFQLADAAGDTLVPNAGMLVDDGGHTCDQASNQITCRWKSSATFKPKSADTVAMNFKIEFTPIPGAGTGVPMKPREWSTDIPLSLLAGSTVDPVVTKSYVDAAVGAAGGGCFETAASSCGSGYVVQASQTHYRCGLDSSASFLATYDSLIPCTTATQWIQGHTVVPFALGQTTTRVCCPKPAS